MIDVQLREQLITDLSFALESKIPRQGCRGTLCIRAWGGECWLDFALPAGCSNTTNTRKCCCVRSSGEGSYPGWLEPVQQTYFVTSSADKITVFGLFAMAFCIFPIDSISLINTKTITLFKIHLSHQWFCPELHGCLLHIGSLSGELGVTLYLKLHQIVRKL